MTASLCPCTSGRPYDACCGPYLEGRQTPDDPEALMRSRYTAFCRGNRDYLVATLDPDKRSGPADLERLRAELSRTMASVVWIGLKVISSKVTGQDKGMVAFAAFFLPLDRSGTARGKQRHEQLHERSFFVRRDGAWYYRDGEILPGISMGRNDLCFCGSQKKFKRCHGRG